MVHHQYDNFHIWYVTFKTSWGYVNWVTTNLMVHHQYVVMIFPMIQWPWYGYKIWFPFDVQCWPIMSRSSSYNFPLDHWPKRPRDESVAATDLDQSAVDMFGWLQKHQSTEDLMPKRMASKTPINWGFNAQSTDGFKILWMEEMPKRMVGSR